jgi:hypothetical protein
MTNYKIERESWWIRLGHAMVPGTHAMSLFAPWPGQRATVLAVYRGCGSLLGRRRGHWDGVAR